MSRTARRDYSLTGPGAAAAVAAGLADATWYSPPIDPERLRVLMERQDWRPARDSALWVVLLVGTAVAAFTSLGHWYEVPAFAVFGALYGGSGDARWHENGHATAFRTRWPNDVFYNIASFMMIREPTLWRWSHFRHHSDTIIVGRDREIGFPRPTRFWPLLLNYLNLVNGPKALWLVVQHAWGRLDATTRELVPKEELRRVAWEARAFVAVLAGAIAWAALAGTLVPLLFVGLPSFYGAWLAVFFGITQHAGLREDVLDHRLNTRTVYLNPVFRFLYLNMNYHVEHHMFPSVPYYNLPALHEEIKAYLPPAKPSIVAAYKEIFHALRRQRRDAAWELPLPSLPDGAQVAWPAPVAPALPVGPQGATGGRGPGTAVDLGPAEALSVGQVVRVDHEGSTYALYRLGEDDFALTDGLCTHARSHLADGHLDGGIIECAKHNGRFDVRTGEAVRRPPLVPLCTYAVWVVDGRLVVDLVTARPDEPSRLQGTS